MQSYQIPDTKKPLAYRARLSPGWAWLVFGLLSTLLSQLFLFYSAIGLTNLIQSRMDSVAMFIAVWVIPVFVEFPGIIEALILTLVLWTGLRFAARFRFGGWIQWLLILLSAQAIPLIIGFLSGLFSFRLAGLSAILIALCVAGWIGYWQQMLLRSVASAQQRRVWIVITIVTYGVIAILHYMLASYLYNTIQLNFWSPNLLSRLEQSAWSYAAGECLIRLIYLVPTAILLQKMVDSSSTHPSEISIA